MPLPSADELEQPIEYIGKPWAVKVRELKKLLHHTETYFNLISASNGSKLCLTSIDDEIYKDFEETFPEIDVLHLDEQKSLQVT